MDRPSDLATELHGMSNLKGLINKIVESPLLILGGLVQNNFEGLEK